MQETVRAWGASAPPRLVYHITLRFNTSMLDLAAKQDCDHTRRFVGSSLVLIACTHACMCVYACAHVRALSARDVRACTGFHSRFLVNRASARRSAHESHTTQPFVRHRAHHADTCMHAWCHAGSSSVSSSYNQFDRDNVLFSTYAIVSPCRQAIEFLYCSLRCPDRHKLSAECLFIVCMFLVCKIS